ncbi:MAG: sulfur oxidation c-type cytochrome SoxA, partial [Betaproteobacteria bacterium]|nr:sulfur oxidation c-type cytochrome SoxA [Betaproteobacteria bacterium]
MRTAKRGRAVKVGVAALVLAVTVASCGVAGLAETRKVAAPLDLSDTLTTTPWQRYAGWTRVVWDRYNNLAHRDRAPTPDLAVSANIGDIGGDVQKGRELAFSRSRGGGCVACHVMGSATPETPGNVGLDLSTIGTAGRSDAYLFDYIYDPRRINPVSIMPPWGSHGLYSADEIRDIVAFLKSLKTPAAFKSALDDPARRTKPVEDRDALDPFINPGIERVAAGEARFNSPGPNGKQCSSCHAQAKAAFADWAATMPQWEPRLRKVLGVEEFILRHAKATTGASYAMGGGENVDLSVYLHFLAHGKPIRVDTSSAPAREALRLGEELYNAKVGQLNFSCADCHNADKGANKWIRGQYLGEVKGQLDHYPAWRTSRNEVWDIRKRFQWC